MSSKKGSLYEVLKSATRAPGEAPPAAPEAPGQPSLQERLAAYKAQKLAAAQAPTAVLDEPTPPPAAPTPLPEPRVVPTVVAPAPVEESAPAKGPGERVLRLTCNTAAFAGLVIVGLVFLAYAVGLKVGRGRASDTSAEAPAPRPLPLEAIGSKPAPPPPPPAPKEYTIRLAEWPYAIPRERVKAEQEALALKDALVRQGTRNVEMAPIQRNGQVRYAMYADRFTDLGAARTRLAALQKFVHRNEKPFAQAAIEELSR
jgi:hypothetical protein